MVSMNKSNKKPNVRGSEMMLGWDLLINKIKHTNGW